MDKLLSMLSPAAPAFAGQDEASPYILPSFADNYEAWAYPETQQAVFDDWIATAAPPPTALASPTSTLSMHSSPLLPSDVALSLSRSLHAPAQPSLSVADYAAVLFPDLAASLTTALASPAEQSPSPSALSPLVPAQPMQRAEPSWAHGLASVLEASPAPMSPASQREPSPADAEADQQRKRRDCEFLESLPPQLRLKRRRTSNSRQKEKILAELLQPAAPAMAVASAPMGGAARPKPEHAAAAAEDSEPSADCESLDAAALKRKKNTDAARRSRMRKILRIETLEGRVSELETENTRLAQKIAQLEAEKAAMAQRMC
ncbi:hypothetical protein H4R23_006258 [Coemansia sp. Cherry 401B]|nr:hypothetical protein H4S01_006456 [Coemansia sp. RSA 2610]KAJ2711967.1 hypothetical protein H4R23_006258 [Coemansia sp. Cherry 401B]